MEAKALKSSFWESSTTEHESLEETWSLNAANVVSGEDFKIDEFFNFSNGGLESAGEEDDDKEEGKKVFFSNQSSGSLTVDGSNSFLSVELAIPGDALADLEWVSHFVDDSCSEFSFFCPAEKSDSEPETFRSEPERQLPGMEISCFPAAFPVRPRTKRPRQTRPSKTLGSSPPSSSSSSTSSGIFPAPYFISTDTDDSFNGSSEPPKKQRKIATHHGGSVSTVQFQRRCSHCLVQKTPQWRTGPHGAKTLCNACGVRYKSGRLFPEYRPALSPTFCSEIHSNSHRKVLEMRRVKDIEKPASGLTQMIPSY